MVIKNFASVFGQLKSPADSDAHCGRHESRAHCTHTVLKPTDVPEINRNQRRTSQTSNTQGVEGVRHSVLVGAWSKCGLF